MEKHGYLSEGICECGLDEEVSEKSLLEDQTKPSEPAEVPLAAPPSRYKIAERTASYVQSRRINDLMTFLMAKLLSEMPDHPLEFLTKLLDTCMIFRAGLGHPPALYDEKHIKQLVKSFDPGDRGWLSASQMRRARMSIGLPPILSDTINVEERFPSQLVVQNLCDELNAQLYDLLSAGLEETQVE